MEEEICEYFWEIECEYGYEEAIESTAIFFKMRIEDVEWIIQEEDRLNNGNF